MSSCNKCLEYLSGRAGERAGGWLGEVGREGGGKEDG